MGYNMYSPCNPCCDCSSNCIISNCPCTGLPTQLCVDQVNPDDFYSIDKIVFPPAELARQTIPLPLKIYSGLPSVGYYSPQITTAVYSGITYGLICSGGTDYILNAYVSDSGNFNYPATIYMQSWTIGSGSNVCFPTMSLESGNNANDTRMFSVSESCKLVSWPTGSIARKYPSLYGPGTRANELGNRPCCGCVLTVPLTDCYGDYLPIKPFSSGQFTIEFTNTSGVKFQFSSPTGITTSIPFNSYPLDVKLNYGNEIDFIVYNNVSPTGKIPIASGNLPSGDCTYRTQFPFYASIFLGSGALNNIGVIQSSGNVYTCCGTLGSGVFVVQDGTTQLKASYYDPLHEWLANNRKSFSYDGFSYAGLSPGINYSVDDSADGVILDPGGTQNDCATFGLLDGLSFLKMQAQNNSYNYRDDFTFIYQNSGSLSGSWVTECKLLLSYTFTTQVYDLFYTGTYPINDTFGSPISFGLFGWLLTNNITQDWEIRHQFIFKCNGSNSGYIYENCYGYFSTNDDVYGYDSNFNPLGLIYSTLNADGTQDCTGGLGYIPIGQLGGYTPTNAVYSQYSGSFFSSYPLVSSFVGGAVYIDPFASLLLLGAYKPTDCGYDNPFSKVDASLNCCYVQAADFPSFPDYLKGSGVLTIHT